MERVKEIKFDVAPKRGFTLIEVLVVILIFGILVGIGVFSLADIGRVSAEGEAERLLSVIKTGREAAISNQTPVMVSVVGRRFILTFMGDQPREFFLVNLERLRLGSTNATQGTPDAASIIESDGICFSEDGVTYDRNFLVFDRKGGAFSGSFYLTDGRRDFAVGVSSSGRIKLWRWGNGNWY
ncbi:MAG: prepilin-type N-terminal cleavage/methylation domain-containing protein [candidate division WOR-3 bacterium]